MDIVTKLSRKQRRLERALGYWEDLAGDISAEKLHTLNEQRTQLYKTLTDGLQDELFVARSAELLTNLYPLGERGGYLKEWIPLMQQAYTSLPPDNPLVCQLLNQLAYSFFQENRLDEADTALKQIPKPYCDRFQSSLSLYYSALILIKRNHLSEAIERLHQSIDNFKALGNRAMQKLGSVYMACAVVYRNQGKYDVALKFSQKAIIAYRNAKDVLYEARSHLTFASIHRENQQYNAALHALDTAEKLLSQTISQPDEIDLWTNRGVIYARQENWKASLAAFEQVNHAFLEENNNPSLLVYVYYNRAFALDKLHQHKSAVPLYQQAQELWIRLGNKAELAINQSQLAEATILSGQLKQGLQLWEASLQMLKAAPQTPFIIKRRKEIAGFDVDWIQKHKCD